MKTLKILIVGAGALLLILSCSTGQLPEGAPQDLSSVLVAFPESLSSTSASSSSVRAVDAGLNSYLDGLYNPVRRAFNPMAEAAVEYVGNLLESVDQYILSSAAAMTTLAAEGSIENSFSGGDQRYLVTLNGDLYSVDIWKTLGDTEIKTLHLTFTYDSDNDAYSGSAWVSDDTTAAAGRTLYRANFDTADAALGKVTELFILNLDQTAEETANEVDRIWLKAWQPAQGELFHVNANIFYNRADVEPETAEHSFFYYYLQGQIEGPGAAWNGTDPFAACYAYRCVADTANDRASVDLALLPAANDSTDPAVIFADYSLGQIYTNAMVTWVRTDPMVDGNDDGDFDDTGDNTDFNFIDAINYLSATSDIPDPPSAATVAEILAALEDASDINSSVAFFLNPLSIDNPGYFTGVDGFVGTSSYETPEWAPDVADPDQEISWSAGLMGGITFVELFDEIAP